MAPKSKLTKEEEWLEKTFKVDVEKFPEPTREGGKARKNFLLWCKNLEKQLTQIEKKNYAKLTSFKSGNPKFRDAQAEATSNYDKMTAAVRKGDLGKAVDTAGTVLSALDDIGNIIGVGSERKLPHGNIQSLGGAESGIGDPSVQKSRKQ